MAPRLNVVRKAMTPRSTYQTALALLARRDHFRRELEVKLVRKGHSEVEIEAAIERCIEIGLVDDQRVAERFVEVRAATRGWGPRRLAAELRQRGVTADDAERLARLSPELAAEAMRTALRRIELRAPDGWWLDGTRKARMVSSLIGRGFAADDAMTAVAGLAVERENQDHAPVDQSRNPIDLS